MNHFESTIQIGKNSWLVYELIMVQNIRLKEQLV